MSERCEKCKHVFNDRDIVCSLCKNKVCSLCIEYHKCFVFEKYEQCNTCNKFYKIKNTI